MERRSKVKITRNLDLRAELSVMVGGLAGPVVIFLPQRMLSFYKLNLNISSMILTWMEVFRFYGWKMRISEPALKFFDQQRTVEKGVSDFGSRQ